MFYIVYKTTNTINNKTYIGQHQSSVLDSEYLGSGKILKRAIAKYGKENFKREILHLCNSKEEMNALEKALVDESVVNDPSTYNLTLGGKGGWYHENSNSQIQRTKALHREINRTPQQRAARSKRQSELMKSLWAAGTFDHIEFNPPGFAGQSHTAEAKRKISVANSKNQRGSKNSQYGSMWVTNGTDNKKIKRGDAIPAGYTPGRAL